MTLLASLWFPLLVMLGFTIPASDAAKLPLRPTHVCAADFAVTSYVRDGDGYALTWTSAQPVTRAYYMTIDAKSGLTSGAAHTDTLIVNLIVDTVVYPLAYTDGRWCLARRGQP